jgi:hypothetical protein
MSSAQCIILALTFMRAALAVPAERTFKPSMFLKISSAVLLRH